MMPPPSPRLATPIGSEPASSRVRLLSASSPRSSAHRHLSYSRTARGLARRLPLWRPRHCRDPALHLQVSALLISPFRTPHRQLTFLSLQVPLRLGDRVPRPLGHHRERRRLGLPRRRPPHHRVRLPLGRRCHPHREYHPRPSCLCELATDPPLALLFRSLPGRGSPPGVAELRRQQGGCLVWSVRHCSFSLGRLQHR